jgi:inner membrane protein
MGRRLGKRALLWGAFLGVVPDMDFIVAPVLGTAREVAWHRGPMHSLLIMAIGSWLLAQGLAKLWRVDKIGKAQAGAFVLAVWWAHVFADCFSISGAAVLWPFLDQRFTFAVLPDVDVLVSAPIAVCALWLAFLPPKLAPKGRGKKAAIAPKLMKSRKICYWGIGLSASYAALAFGMKSLATTGFDADLARRGVTSVRRLEMPTRLNILLWRAVVDRGDEFWIGYRSVLEARDAPVRWTVVLKRADILEKVAAMRETKTLRTVSDGWWIARPHVKGAWLGDLRFPEHRIWGSKKGMVDSRLPYSWVIDATEKSDHLRDMSAHEENSAEYLERMAKRIFPSDENDWDGIPRLAGVAGSLPEFLTVQE